MRTTLTLDDDVAAMIKRLRTRSGARAKQIVNEALRRGLREMVSPAPAHAPYRTPSTSLGRCLLPDLDGIAEVLAAAERENLPLR